VRDCGTGGDCHESERDQRHRCRQPRCVPARPRRLRVASRARVKPFAASFSVHGHPLSERPPEFDCGNVRLIRRKAKGNARDCGNGVRDFGRRNSRHPRRDARATLDALRRAVARRRAVSCAG
jgi:hypothetical protein